jgi:CubicO group peptidase (beta-lactamase class C family)/uncharacterized membrane protein
VTKGRLEAFSDGVIAIIITIMVLELKVPHGETLADLQPVAAVLMSYVLSFIYIGIYWNNHHHMFHVVKHVRGGTLWANLHLLFWLSLVPFVTAWMGENHFAQVPVAVYGCVLFMAGVAYFILAKVLVAHHGPESALAQAIGADRKGLLSLVIYATAIGLSSVSSDAAMALYVAVAVMWLIPDRRIERLYSDHSARLLIVCVLSAVTSVVVAASPPGPPPSLPLPRATPASVGLDAAALNAATDLLRQFTAEHRIAGAVAGIARHGKVAYLESVGVQDLESRAPMTDRSLFRIYSMTKSVTAVAVMMLVEEGRLSLGDPVSKFLPEFKEVRVQSAPESTPRPPAREITIHDLLLHTSGLNHRTSALYRTAKVRLRGISLAEFVTNVVRTPLMENPGTRFRYSEATTVIGRVVEVVTKTSFDRYLRDRVLGPLEMNDTTFWVAGDDIARLTTVYSPMPSGDLMRVEIEEVPFTVKPALIEGAVGLVSTVPDYVRFCQMLLNRGTLDGVRLLNAATVDEITRNGLSPEVLTTRGGTMGWGLANVNVQMDPASPLLDEYGWDGTAGTIFWVDPAREMITVLMTQSSPADPDNLRRRFKTLVQRAIGL